MDWESGGRRRRSSDRVAALVVAGGIAVLVILMFVLLRSGGGSGEDSELERSELQKQEEMLARQAASMEDLIADRNKPQDGRPKWHIEFQADPQGFIQKIRPVAEGFMQAETWQERLKFCADPERVAPLIKAYYEDGEDGPVQVRELFSGASVDIGERFLTGRVMLENFDAREFVMLLEGDTWVIDWESFVGYSSMPINEFVAEKTSEPQLFRLSVSMSVPPYFNYSFSDEQGWDCYVLTDPKADVILYGYAAKFSKEASALKDMFSVKGKAAATLMLRFPEGAESANQVEISEVIGEGWVPALSKSYDEKKD